jgi:hypothetical protein
MDPTKAKTRLTQELAQTNALREKLLAGVRADQKYAEAFVVGLNKRIAAMRPLLERWKDAGFPDNPKLEKLARRYLKALHLRQDAAMAASRNGQLLAEHTEMDTPEEGE